MYSWKGPRLAFLRPRVQSSARTKNESKKNNRIAFLYCKNENALISVLKIHTVIQNIDNVRTKTTFIASSCLFQLLLAQCIIIYNNYYTLFHAYQIVRVIMSCKKTINQKRCL